jgi:hypothetical protein
MRTESPWMLMPSMYLERCSAPAQLHSFEGFHAIHAGAGAAGRDTLLLRNGPRCRI